MNISKNKNISDSWVGHTDKLRYPDILTIILYIIFKKGKIIKNSSFNSHAKFKTSLIYKIYSRMTRATQRNRVLKKKTKQTNDHAK